MNILIIDDDRKFSKGLRDSLEIDEHQVTVCHSPTEGIQEAREKKYDIIFIDFLFENDKAKTGADVGYEIRKIQPLAALIIVTAFGTSRLRDFVWVGFDDFLSKYDEGAGANLNRMNEDLEACIANAQQNRAKRIKTQYSEDETKNVREYLDYMEKTICFLIDNNRPKTVNMHTVAAGCSLLRAGKVLDIGILADVANPTTRNKTLKNYNLNQYNSISVFFQVRDRDGTIREEVLKTRQLLMNNPTEWPSIKTNVAPIKAIIEEFKIQ